MGAERISDLESPLVRTAIEDLKRLVLAHYPSATFTVEPSVDDPYAIHLVTTVETLDTTDVLDTVFDRMMEIQIEQGLPIFVIPVRPVEPVQ